MCARASAFAQVELRAPDDDLVAVLDEVLEHAPSSVSTRGRPSTSASMITPNVVCICVCL